MTYIIYCSALIGLSYVIYILFLSKETFYKLNRWTLLSLVLISFALPFLSVPENLSLKTIFFQEPIFQTSSTKQSENINLKNMEEEALVPDHMVTTHTEDTKTNITPASININWKSIIIYIYFFGVLAFGGNFLLQLGVLLYRMFKYPTIEFDKYKIVETTTHHAPYSFWNRIFINPNLYTPETYLQILKHEQIHIDGKHSMDMLLVELLVTIQWFNPFAWLYRKAIDNNLEYLTDNGMLNIGENKEVYQMNLLKVSTPDMPTGLATSYNQSFLKKRILMMNSKKSTAKSGWKYLIIIPLLVFTVLSFNPVISNKVPSENEDFTSAKPDTSSRELQQKEKNKNDVTKGVWDAEVGAGKLCIMYRSAEPLKQSFWSTTRCYDASFFDDFPKGDKQKFEITKEAGTMTLIGTFDGSIGNGRYTFTPNTEFIKSLQNYGLRGNQKKLIHCFLTDFDTNYLTYLKNEGLAINQDDFEDIIHKSLPLDTLKMYRNELKKLGYNTYTIKEISKLNLFDVDIPYISFINKIGEQKVSLKKVIKAKIHNLTPNFIKSYTDNGHLNMSLDDYMKLKIHNVTPDFISDFKKEGYGNISVKEAQNLKIHNVTPGYIEEYKNIGYQNITLKEAKELKIHNVTPAFIKSLRKVGYPNITLKEAKKLKVHNVTPNLIESYKKAGQKNLSVQEVIKLKIHDITPGQVKISTQHTSNWHNNTYVQSSSTSNSGNASQDNQQMPNDFIEQFKKLGYTQASIDEIIALKIHNITPEFIKRYHKAGYKDIPLDDIVGLKIHQVTPEFIDTFKKAGFKNISIEDAMSLKTHNISPEYIRQFKKTMFDDLPLAAIMSFKIHNITPEFINSFEDIGYKNITADQAQSLKIHNVTPGFIKSLKEQDPEISIEQAIRIKIHF
ncbi:M56 family metallopeptidase [Aquimarina sp. RZ0]|uniref:M56 family metallopeptidase n=1 Tax=Aquimarina sp. RZ0 TaxID=2607730 RepID=UPI0011F1BFC9|nr:M56 family metallopeptidase [Aquimarina sp. RZ0]KAA1247961.1 M56 family metallopeptidase [Aquimarina sp. RZ0]